MTRREEMMVNATLLFITLTLITFIVLGPEQEDLSIPRVSKSTGTTTNRTTDSTANPIPDDPYVNVGKVPVFQALLTPTPTPPPPTPRPTPTPDISQAFGKLTVVSIMDGVITFQDNEKAKTGAADAIFEMKPGDKRMMDAGRGEQREVVLEAIDEKTNPDNPSATFKMQDTTDKKTLNLYGAAPPQ